MKIKDKDGMLEITTELYQAKNGGIFMNFGNGVIKIEKFFADTIARDIAKLQFQIGYLLSLIQKLYERGN